MAVDVGKLPAPVNGEAEVQFRRFLSRCYDRATDATSDDWKRNPVFHRYVEELQNQLGHLRNRPSHQWYFSPRGSARGSSVRLPADLVAQYVRHVEYLSSALLTPTVPLYCKKLRNRGAKPRGAGLSAQPSASRPDVYRNFGRLLRSSELQDDAKEKLETQTALQESMTEDLVKLARDLKHGSRAVQAALDRRDAAIASTSDALDFSAEAAKAARKGASKQYKTSRTGTCRMLMILLFVGCVFTAMIFFIRITSLIGYRAKNKA